MFGIADVRNVDFRNSGPESKCDVLVHYGSS